MSAHERHRLHVNSLDAYRRGELTYFSKRELEVLATVNKMGVCTDREVMIHLQFTDMNTVRPRITELVEDGLLEEVGTLECPVTGRPVRKIRLKEKPSGVTAAYVRANNQAITAVVQEGLGL